MPSLVDPTRITLSNNLPHKPGPILYWMSRDQRVTDNWAILYAQELALKYHQPLAVFTCFRTNLTNHSGTSRLIDFMFKGLSPIETTLADLNIPFFLKIGEPIQELSQFILTHHISTVITDFSPLRQNQSWAQSLSKLSVSHFEIDTHNIIPYKMVSPKQEYAAHTFRPKVHKLLDEYLTQIPSLKSHPINWPTQTTPVSWLEVTKSIKVDTQVPSITWLKPGEKAASLTLTKFINHKLSGYSSHRNDPTKDSLSNLSPYLHFGHISAQRVALEINQSKAPSTDKQTFLEELIVRKELSDNYCFYNKNYDSVTGFHPWAQQTLLVHQVDPRPDVYSLEQLELASTHDNLWNAAQQEMVITGKMHGYLRMYWAKKILEWTDSPQIALQFAITLNDKYSLDGRDPNGYTGIAWSIGGVHDRPWFERPIFGKIRYMNSNGAHRKFNVETYIHVIENIQK